VIFAQMVDVHPAHPDLFPTVKKQDKKGSDYFALLKDLVLWENTTNEAVLQKARDEIWASLAADLCRNADHLRQKNFLIAIKTARFS
jgi:putative DNA methylase